MKDSKCTEKQFMRTLDDTQCSNIIIAKNIIIKCTYSISYYEKNIESLKNMNISISTDAINECNL